MPIKFRCVYCEQRLGIARRKAGTVVKCPNCTGQLIVPAEDQAVGDDLDGQTAAVGGAEAASAPRRTAARSTAGATESGGEGGLLFERSDFDDLLRPAIERHQPERAPAKDKPRPTQTEAPLELSDEHVFSQLNAPAAPATPRSNTSARPSPGRTGILLTPFRAALVCIVAVAVAACSFGGGIVVGMLLKRP